MKIPSKNSQLRPGLTLIELTVIIIVTITLIMIFYFSANGYIRESNRATCLTVQSKIKKNTLSYGLMVQPLSENTEYYGNENIEAAFGDSPNCPQTGGGYSVMLDPSGKDLVVTCTLNGAEHH